MAVVLIMAFMSMVCGCDTEDLEVVDGLYPYHPFYIYCAPLWTTFAGGLNHDETINYDALSAGRKYLIDDHGVLAIGSDRQKWMLMADEKGLEFSEATLRTRRFAIKNVTTGRFINTKGLTVQSMLNADQGEQVLVTEFEWDYSFFWGINPQMYSPGREGPPAFINANIVSGDFNNSLFAGFLCLMGNSVFRTMKPSENTKNFYAVQYLYGERIATDMDPEHVNYWPDPLGCAVFNFSTY